MVHGLAAQSGGFLRIDSAPNVGTTVQLWLPRAKTEPVSAARNVERLKPPPAASKPCRVLIVDDDQLVLTGTAALIEDLGHTAVEAHSGAEALSTLAAGTQVDLVMTDHAMPSMTGMQLAQILQERYPGLPIILATGFAELPSDPARLRIQKLAKPCTQHDIAVAIQTALNSRNSTQAYG
jgi:CheY-like chemotaxis protein